MDSGRTKFNPRRTRAARKGLRAIMRWTREPSQALALSGNTRADNGNEAVLQQALKIHVMLVWDVAD